MIVENHGSTIYQIIYSLNVPIYDNHHMHRGRVSPNCQISPLLALSVKMGHIRAQGNTSQLSIVTQAPVNTNLLCDIPFAVATYPVQKKTYFNTN